MKSRIITFIMLCIYIVSNAQNTWSKEYDLGQGRKNFLRYIMTDHGESKIYISSWQFCPTEISNINLECSVISNYNKNGDIITELVYDSTAGVENGNIIDFDGELGHISVLNTDSLGKYYQLVKFDSNLDEKSKDIISFGNDSYSVLSGIVKIDENNLIFGTLISYSNNQSQSFFAKLDDSLNVEIINKYPARQLNVFMNDLQPTPDSNLAFILKQRGPAGPSGWLGYEIYKVDHNGTILDTFKYEDYVGQGEHTSLTIDDEGNYYFSSYLHPITKFPGSIGQLNKLSKDMKTLEWSVILPNSTYGRQYRIEESILARNGDIVICGSVYDHDMDYDGPHTTHNGFITRFDQEGNIVWHHIYKVPNDEYLPQSEYGRYRFSRLTKMVEMEDGSLLAGGNHAYHWTVYDHLDFDDTKETNLLWLLKVDANGCLEGEECDEVIEIGRGIESSPIYSIGANWTYEFKNHPASFVGFQKYNIVDTTTWEGEKAFIIEPGLWEAQDYMLAQNNKIYFWDKELGDYQLNYDFDNDSSYQISFMNQNTNQIESTIVYVDSMKLENINGVNHSVQYCRSSLGVGNIARPFEIINQVGSNYGGPRLPIGFIIDNITDDIQRIRCYENDTIEYVFTEVTCDSTWYINSIDEVASNDIILYPNPSNGKVWIKGIDKDVEFEVYDFQGKLINKGMTIDKSLSLEKVGLHLIRFRVNDNWIWRKIVN